MTIPKFRDFNSKSAPALSPHPGAGGRGDAAGEHDENAKPETGRPSANRRAKPITSGYTSIHPQPSLSTLSTCIQIHTIACHDILSAQNEQVD